MGLAPLIAAAPFKKVQVGFVMNVPGDYVHCDRGDPTQSDRTSDPFRPLGAGNQAIDGRDRTISRDRLRQNPCRTSIKKSELPLATLSIDKVEDLDRIGEIYEVCSNCLKGKTAIVTGGTAGIGKAIASFMPSMEPM